MPESARAPQINACQEGGGGRSVAGARLIIRPSWVASRGSRWPTHLGGIDIATPTPSARYREFLRVLHADPAVEHAYQALFDNFQLAQVGTPAKTLLVTSTQPEEGKTTVAAMLALTAALAGKRVLLVDADLRKPRLHRLLGLASEPGLADLLDSTSEASTELQPLEATAHDDGGVALALTLLSSGGGRGASASASQRLGSPRMKEILDELAPQFDLVVIDSPPVLSVTDPLFLAPIVDGVLLVLAVGVVGEQDAKDARERIVQAGGRLLGVVMNRFDERLHGAGVHPYRESYFDASRRLHGKEGVAGPAQEQVR